jgi:hypothetical protein
MKNFITAIYECLLSWGEAVAEYRNSKASHHYY